MMGPKNKSSISTSRPLTHSVYHHNKLQVFVKFRPPINIPKSKTSPLQLFPQNDNPIKYLNPNELQIENSMSEKIYQFDRVFHHSSKSEEVFNTICKEMIENTIMTGGHGLLLAYGNTGTGKTYTMGLLEMLNARSKGIIPQTLAYIFEKQRQLKKKSDYQLGLSIEFAQVYLDEIFDLFEYDSQKDKKLIIRENQETKDPYVENQMKINVQNLEQAYQLLNIGLENRHIAEQKINKRSSRGHGVITLNFNTYDSQSQIGKLCFVDLAGSQRIKQSESKGQNLNEAVKINSSLSALETLLSNISEQTVRMYRGNKLTRLLQPYIERGKIKLIVASGYENIQPIQFAKRCKGIKFMEKSLQSISLRKSLSPLKKTSQASEHQINKIHASYKQREKMMCKCLTGMVALLTKIIQTVEEIFSNLNVQSCYSVSDIASFQPIQKSINERINTLENFQRQLIEQELDKGNRKTDSLQSNSTSISATQRFNWELLSLVPNVDSGNFNQESFLSKLHETGYHVINSIKNMGKLSEYKNLYKKQLFTSELKCHLLQDKTKKNEEVLSICFQTIFPQNNHSNSISPTSISSVQKNKLIKNIVKMGVEFQKIMKNSIKIQIESKTLSKQKISKELQHPKQTKKHNPVQHTTKVNRTITSKPFSNFHKKTISQQSYHTPKLKKSQTQQLSRKSADFDQVSEMQRELNSLNLYLQKQEESDRRKGADNKTVRSYGYQNSSKNNQFIYIVER